MTRMYVNISVISCSMCFASLTVMLLLFAMEMTLQRQWKAKSRIDWKLTSRYIEKLRHSIEKINKRHKLEESKKKELEESKKESELSWWLFFISRNTANGKQDTPKESLLQPLQLPPRVSRVPTMVIRLVPATDLLDNALRSYGYSPLLELTVRPTLTVRSLFVHLRSRWEKFCQRVQGVFRLAIASSSTAGVWVENRVQGIRNPPEKVPILSNTNSLLSYRMEKSENGTMEVNVINMWERSVLMGTTCPIPLNNSKQWLVVLI